MKRVSWIELVEELGKEMGELKLEEELKPEDVCEIGAHIGDLENGRHLYAYPTADGLIAYASCADGGIAAAWEDADEIEAL